MPGAQALQESSTEIFLTQNNYVLAKIKLLITNLSRKHFINKNHVVNPPTCFKCENMFSSNYQILFTHFPSHSEIIPQYSFL